MKNTHRILLSVLLSGAIQFLTAQQSEWCGTMQNVQRQIDNNPALLQQFENFKNQLNEYAQNPASGSRAGGAQIYIPVVFHIVHNGDALGTGENIPDAQVYSQIDALNRDYNFLDPDNVNIPQVWQSLAANVNVKFCLAKFDENGNPTTGIIRHQYANATWDEDVDIDNTLKPATIWDKNKFLNIWSIRMGGTLLSSGVLAYSSFPIFGQANQDGIVARFQTIGATTTFPKAKTVTHEVGHWLGLLHVWGNNANCGDAGDYINDTPDQADLNFGCPTFPSISCNNGPNGDMFMNYMDYSDEGCRNMYTLDQSDRMHSILDGTRSSIKNASTQCFYNLDASVLNVLMPSDTFCNVNFKPLVEIRNEGSTVLTSGKFYFQIDGGATQIVNWSGYLNIQESAFVTLPEQSVSQGNHTFDVTFSNTNGLSNDNYAANDNKTITFFAYDGGGATGVPFTENFETIFPAANWGVYNPNSDVTWVQNYNAGAYGLSGTSASINNLGYATNPGKKKDAMVTDVYDISGLAYPELTFDIAYARYNPARADSLNVYYSLDCGNNWIKAWNGVGSELATAADKTTLFVPAYEEWKTISVPLLNITGQSKLMIKFENVTGWGNALYLDNVNLRNNQALAVEEIKKVDVKIFPNPASTMVGVKLPFRHGIKQIQLLNSMGQVLISQNLTDNSVIIPVSEYASGLYFIQLKGVDFTQTEKLFISK